MNGQLRKTSRCTEARAATQRHKPPNTQNTLKKIKTKEFIIFLSFVFCFIQCVQCVQWFKVFLYRVARARTGKIMDTEIEQKLTVCRQHAQITSSAYRVFAHLCHVSPGINKKFAVSVKDIAKEIKLSHATIIRATAQLEEHSFIGKEHHLRNGIPCPCNYSIL